MNLRNRVLIVEDDKGSESILRQVIRSVDPEAQVDVTDNAETAALTLVQERSRGQPYNLVIADIFLEGKLTGLDLWRIYREFSPSPPMVFTSSLSWQRFLQTIGDQEPVPIFLAKPFLAEECRMVVRRFMANI